MAKLNPTNIETTPTLFCTAQKCLFRLSYIGIGANLDNPSQQIHDAMEALAKIPQTRVNRHSRLYRNAPMGPVPQPDYVNAVAEIESVLPPLKLLAHLQQIENAQGRKRTGLRWGPRTLDLDILLYGEEEIRHPALTVPHPGISVRAFVLYPLAEIAPSLCIPGLGSVANLLDNCPPHELYPLTASHS